MNFQTAEQIESFIGLGLFMLFFRNYEPKRLIIIADIIYIFKNLFDYFWLIELTKNWGINDYLYK